MTQQQQTQANQGQTASTTAAAAPRTRQPLQADGRIVYRYIVGADGRRVAIARRLVEENGQTVLQVGWSSCAPQDNFDRSLARTIASGRLENTRSRISSQIEAGMLAKLGNADLNTMAAGMVRNSTGSKLVQDTLSAYLGNSHTSG